MKKSLSAILATSMAFSMFASAAFAADATLDTEGKFQALKTAGIFQGYPDGKSHLEANMTRAEFAKALAALLNLTGDATAAASFTDVPANHWAIGEIGALAEQKILEGIGAGKFGPKLNVTIEQVAKIVVTAVGLEPKADATVEGKTSAWATGYVAAAVEAGLIPASADYTKLATRGDLVDASFVVYEKVQTSVKSTKVVDSKNIEVTFTDGGVVKKELTDALKVGVATKVSVEYKGKTFEVEVKLESLAAEAKVTGAKSIEVKLNQAVDTAKATFEVKNAAGSVVNTKEVKFADDKMTATLSFVNSLPKGEYTIAVKGIQDPAVSAKVTVEEEKIAKIEFASDKLVIDRGVADDKQAYTSFKVLNQYNEDVTSSKSSSIKFTVGKSGTNEPTASSNGTLTVSVATAATSTKFVKDEKITITAIEASSNVFASGVFTVVDKASVSEVTVEKLYNADNKTLVKGNTADKFYLLVTGKDQYGNTISNPTYFEDDLLVTASNTSVANYNQAANKPDFEIVKIDGKDNVALQVTVPADNGLAGTSKITLWSKASGKNASFDVAVRDTIKIDQLTLSQPAVAVVGEEITIPFSAVDQFGNAITKASDLNAGVTSASASGGTAAAPAQVKFVQDYVKNTAVLKVTGIVTKGSQVVSIISGTKVFQITINVVDSKYAKEIGAIKDFTPSFAVDANATYSFSTANVVVKDQYGRDITPTYGTGVGQYRIKIESSSTDNVTVSGTDLSSAVTFKALKKGSSTITLTLEKNEGTAAAANWKQVADSQPYTFTAKVVEKADIASYEIVDLPQLYSPAAPNNAYAKKIEVKGVLADGSKVSVPGTYFKVAVPAGSGVAETAADSDTLIASGDTGFTNGVKDVTVTVTVEANEKPEVLSKVVKVSTADSKVAKLELVDVTGYKKEDGNVISTSAANAAVANQTALVNAVVKATDQYGVERTGAGAAGEPAYTIVRSNVADNDKSETVTAGDTFFITVTVDGQSLSFQVVVTA